MSRTVNVPYFARSGFVSLPKELRKWGAYISSDKFYVEGHPRTYAVEKVGDGIVQLKIFKYSDSTKYKASLNDADGNHVVNGFAAVKSYLENSPILKFQELTSTIIAKSLYSVDCKVDDSNLVQCVTAHYNKSCEKIFENSNAVTCVTEPRKCQKVVYGDFGQCKPDNLADCHYQLYTNPLGAKTICSEVNADCLAQWMRVNAVDFSANSADCADTEKAPDPAGILPDCPGDAFCQ